MHNFRELKIWQDAMQMARLIHKTTRNFPVHERFSLTAQINRAAVSIPSNIAEGAGRNSNKEFTQFLNISLGSCFELETQMILAFDFGYIEKDEFDTFILHINKLEKMINSLNTNLRKQLV